MPIEIRELKIRVTIDENARRKNAWDHVDVEALKNKIVRECVEKVVKKVKNLADR